MNLFRHRWLYFLFSSLIIVPGLVSLALNGLKLGIDFAGGSLIELAISQPVKLEEIQSLGGVAAEIRQLQASGENQIVLRGPTMSNQAKDELVATMAAQLGQIEELRFESVGPTISRELLTRTLAAAALAAIVILIYVGRQFKEISFGVSAVLAMFHDSLVLLGVFSLLGWQLGVEVDTLFVTAILTTLSFSVHDTIVVYHKIRELRPQFPQSSWSEIGSRAVMETLTRSLNNSVTIVLMLLALVLIGGQTIRWFAFALLLGAVTGTYSSPFVAVPLLVEWHEGAFLQKLRRRPKAT